MCVGRVKRKPDKRSNNVSDEKGEAMKKKSEQSCKVEHTRAALQGSADGKISNHLEEQTKPCTAINSRPPDSRATD